MYKVSSQKSKAGSVIAFQYDKWEVISFYHVMIKS